MKTLLISVQPNIDTIGLKYIHSNLIANGIDSKILFIPKVGTGFEESFQIFLHKLNPQLIAVSLMSPEFHKAKKLSSIIKKLVPTTPLIWGGIHPTIDPRGCLDYCDFVFRGESESSFLNVVEALKKGNSINKIRNVSYKSKDNVILNPLELPEENLDLLPFPEHLVKESYIFCKEKIRKLNLSIFKKYARYQGRIYNLITTRGCPFSCAYCCNSFFSRMYESSKIRMRSVENVIEELETAISNFPRLSFVNIQDDNFLSYDVEWLKKFKELYKKKIDLKFCCRSTPVHLTEEKISLLKEAGLFFVVIGLQSGSPRINKDVFKRYVSNERFIQTTKLVRKYNVTCSYDIIVDNPYENECNQLATINTLLKIPKPYNIQIFSLCFYQGTEIYFRALKEGLINEDALTKDYLVYQPTMLNQIIRLCPIIPNRIIKNIIKNRKKKLFKYLVNVIYWPTKLFIEPLVWLYQIYLSSNRKLVGTLKMATLFSNNAYKIFVLRNSKR